MMRVSHIFLRLTGFVAIGCVLLMGGVLAAAQIFPDDALYFISSRDGNYRIYATDLSRNFTRKLHNQPVGFDITLSPDGSRIAFVGIAQQAPALFVMDWNGKNLQVINQPTGQQIANPLWSPDNEHLAFTLRGDGQVDIHVISADGSGQRRLPIESAEMEKQLLAWSPDGSQIAFRTPNSQQPAIWVIQADGSQPPATATEGITATWAQWSPDGAQLVYVATSRGTFGRQVYVQDAECVRVPAQDSCSLTALGETQMAGVYDQALWSPDNQHILLHSARTRQPGTRYIYVMDADGKQWPLTNHSQQAFAPAWSPRGERIAYVTGGLNGSPKLFIAGLDGQVEQISHDIFSYYSPEWWPG